MNAAAQRRLTPPLVILVLLLGALLLAFFVGLGGGVHWDAPHAGAPPPPARQGNKLPEPVPLEQFAVVWKKPLFSPDRKPVAHAAGDGNLGDLQLTGIILTRDLRMALLRDKRGDTFRVREGGSLPDGSWTLAELKPRSALFDAPSGRTELQLPAGAPIDNVGHEGDSAKSPRPAADGAAPEASAAPAASASPLMRIQAPPRAGGNKWVAGGDGGDGAARPHQDAATLQAQRVQQLKAAIQKRRAAQAKAAHEGDR